MTEFEKQKKEEDTKIPVANTIPISNQKYPKVHFQHTNPTRNYVMKLDKT
jgi:hypothetical protein